MEERALRKKKFFMALPLLVVPLVTMVFWAMGGGQLTTPTAGKPKGLNAQLPEAQISENPLDKFSLYQKAEKDSLNLASQRKRDGIISGLLDQRLPLNDTYDDSPGSSKQVRQEPYSSHQPSAVDPAEARVNRKLQELDRALNASVDTTHHQPGTVTTGIPAASVDGSDISKLEQMLSSLNNTAPGSGDPEMNQLSDMLQKILEVQHPEMVKEKLKNISLKDKKRVIPVSLEQGGEVTDLLAAPSLSKDSASLKSDTTRSLASGKTPANRFFEMDDLPTEDASTGAVAAVVDETQVLVEGATAKLRLEQDIYLHGQLIPRGTLVFGKCSLKGDRLMIPVTDIRYGRAVYPVSLSTYSLDGLEGIHIQGSITGDVSKQSANDALQGLQLAALDPSITQQAAAAGIDAVKTIMNKKARLIKTTVKAGHPVLLLDKKDQD